MLNPNPERTRTSRCVCVELLRQARLASGRSCWPFDAMDLISCERFYLQPR
jgi:hypothetical protein